MAAQDVPGAQQPEHQILPEEDLEPTVGKGAMQEESLGCAGDLYHPGNHT